MSANLDPVCGCIGCTELRVAIVEVPGKGKRAVCEDHLEDQEVTASVE